MNISAINDFRKFVEKEVEPGARDLENLDEKNRVHVQKLVFTNLVDRFDTMLDVSLLENCRTEILLDIALRDLSGPVVESDLMKLLMQGEKKYKMHVTTMDKDLSLIHIPSPRD